MNNKALKVILSSTAALACALSLSASTFAYVLIGNSVTVEDFQFNIEHEEGLLVSLTESDFSQDITSDMLKEHIAGSVANFDALTFQGVTPKMEAAKISYLNNDVLFQYDSVNRATHTHSFEDAIKNKDYIQFDLYFKVVSGSANSTGYKLVFGEDTQINPNVSFPTIRHSFTAGSQSFEYGQQVTQNVANAVRVGVFNEKETKKFNIFEVTDSNDLGTTAIEGRTDEHDPSKNVMYNYYNVVHNLEPFTQAAPDGEAYDTIDHYGTGSGDTWSGQELATFDENGVAKITVYLWLEGWDADFLIDTSLAGSKVSATLEFALSK